MLMNVNGTVKHGLSFSFLNFTPFRPGETVYWKPLIEMKDNRIYIRIAQ